MALYEKVAMDIVAKRQQDEERDRSIEVCTRYYVELSPELRPYIEAASRSRLKESMVTKLGRAFKFSGEIRPTDIAAVIAPGPGGEKRSRFIRWSGGIMSPVSIIRLSMQGQSRSGRRKPFPGTGGSTAASFRHRIISNGNISGSLTGVNKPAAGMPFSLPDPMSPIWPGCTGLKRGRNLDIRYLRFLPERRERS